LKSVFEIDILEGLNSEDVAFAKLTFHRRHVYEHLGGEADEKYIAESGDSSVRVKQALGETKKSAHRFTSVMRKMVRNLHDGFHEIRRLRSTNTRHFGVVRWSKQLAGSLPEFE
jgi:hypothetical protein